MRRRTAACWTLMLLAATFCDIVAGKGGRGGARGAARGSARGASRVRVKAAPRYGSAGTALRVAGAAAAGAAAGVAAGAALRRARLPGELDVDNGADYGDANRTAAASSWTSAAQAWDSSGWAASWLCPLAAFLHL
ncbi:shadow of prion protein [Apteryx mantelli]|uniref:Shadow of prion protein n=1 Tax=Apteryx mantelli TaxID=2696672 RepID=A0ABM4ESL4_9AVES